MTDRPTDLGTRPAAPKVRFPISLKMAVALVVPLATVAILNWFRVQEARDNVKQVNDETQLASVALAPGGLVDALIIERGDSSLSVLGMRDSGFANLPTADFAESTESTDVALAELRQAVAQGGALAEAAYGPLLSTIDEDLAEQRSRVADGMEEPGLGNWDLSNDVYNAYTPIVDGIDAATRSLAAEITDPRLRASGTTLADVLAIHDTSSNLIRYLGTAIGPGDPTQTRDDVVKHLDRFAQARSTLDLRTDGPWADQVEAFADNANYDEIIERAELWLDSGELDLDAIIALNPDASDRSAGTSLGVYDAANDALGSRVQALRDQAADDERRYVMTSILVLLGATIIAGLMARSIASPMRSLTRQADDMATKRLPQAVKAILDTPVGTDIVAPDFPEVRVRSLDESTTIAHALNQVQSSAIDLAVEQATLRHHSSDSFLHMGRRTQNLIGLQLELITELEQDETDPTALDQLYRLDHLATRARRNAESLVVLAGTEPPRSGAAPVRMTDVIRAMLSEVAEYQRVDISSVDQVSVSGGIAADLIHLLAELVENGLTFSPPGKEVQVAGRMEADRYVLAVVDEGVGMLPDRIDQANRRLAGEESFTVAPSRYLGHYVTGRLAARVGARVSVHAGEKVGLVALVEIPASLVTAIGDADEPANEPRDRHADDRTDGPPPTGADAPTDARVDGRPPVLNNENGTVREEVQALSGHSDQNRSEAPAAEDEAGSVLTDSGLRKRTPGRQSQVTQRSMRLKEAGLATAGTDEEESPRSTQVASLLATYSSGVERGLDELGRRDSTDAPSDS